MYYKTLKGEIIERTYFNDMYNIPCNFVGHELITSSIRNKLSKFSHNRQVIDPDFYHQWFNVWIKAVAIFVDDWKDEMKIFFKI